MARAKCFEEQSRAAKQKNGGRFAPRLDRPMYSWRSRWPKPSRTLTYLRQAQRRQAPGVSPSGCCRCDCYAAPCGGGKLVIRQRASSKDILTLGGNAKHLLFSLSTETDAKLISNASCPPRDHPNARRPLVPQYEPSNTVKKGNDGF